MKNYPEILRSIGGYFDEAAQREISCAEVADYIEKLKAELAALRKQQSEPVVWMYENKREKRCEIRFNRRAIFLGETESPLYRKSTARVPEGWKLVPIGATGKMIDATSMYLPLTTISQVEYVYSAMLDVAHEYKGDK